MGRNVAIGIQDFSTVIEKNCFYIDKTSFIKEWWESNDAVTLINRPRRFGKTLNMSMIEQFFSVDYAGRGDLFGGLSIWQEEKYRNLQGTYPVISLSFANVKERTMEQTRKMICRIIKTLYDKFDFLLEGSLLSESEKQDFRKVSEDMESHVVSYALHALSNYLYRYYGKKVIILLDEYDTPMQEAYVHGYWEELVSLTRSMFNSTFKTNPYLERALMTGITRVSKESIFSDLNNLEVITTSSDKYETAFGFTEEEVFAALDECGLGKEKEKVKEWYDGFIFGEHKDIYNPWSVLNFLDKRKYNVYWANSSSNALVNKLIREGNREVKEIFEGLLNGESYRTEIDEQIVYNQLSTRYGAIWSLLLASGYLKAAKIEFLEERGKFYYTLELTNKEVRIMFSWMVRDWFSDYNSGYNDFLKALILGDLEAMNTYMNRVALTTFSSFDTGIRPSRQSEPERFYHGFVLGLMISLEDDYMITSNRESGFGRYDIMIEPRDKQKDAIIIEFKVYNANRESSLEETVAAAHAQIEEKQYEATLVEAGIAKERIRKYGFAFEGKKVLIG